LEAANQSGTKIRKAVKIYEREREMRGTHTCHTCISGLVVYSEQFSCGWLADEVHKTELY
jgi:hypothetical protein